MILYNYKGYPIAYSENEKEIYLFSGKPVAYFYGDLLYSFTGVQLGRFEKGWVRDLEGYCVFFTNGTSIEGPALPAQYAIPAKGAKSALPAQSAMHAPKAKHANRNEWSRLSGENFFYQ